MARARIPRIKEFPKDGRYWRVDWFGAIQRNPQIPTEPYFQIVISPFLEDPAQLPNKDLSSVTHTSPDEQKIIRIGVGQLPAIWIGSIWKDGICQQRWAGITAHFPNLDVTDKSINIIPANYQHHGKALIPYNYYRYGAAGFSSKLLAIEWEGDPFGILIPAMEVLRFYYAASSNLSHAIFSGAFTHDLDSIVHTDRTDYLPEEKRFLLGLRQHMLDEEGWIIARILHSDEAWRGCTRIHDYLMKQSLNSDFTHIETNFPFFGHTNLQARCKQIRSYGDNKWRTLILSLESCTGPLPYKELTVIRDNSGDPADPETDIPNEQKKLIDHHNQSNQQKPDQELQSEQETNKTLSTVEIPLPTDRFPILTGRKPDKPTKEQCEYRSNYRFRNHDMTEMLGTGQGSYGEDGKGAQKVNLASNYQRRKAASPSFEIFKEAINKLNTFPGITATIKTLDKSTIYIPLVKPSGSWQWPYLNSSTQQRRNVIAADITYKGDYYTLVEFEIRQNESFRVALIHSSTTQLNNRGLQSILLQLARQKGKWKNITDTNIGNMLIIALKHTWSSPDAFRDSLIKKITHADLQQTGD